MERRHSDAPFPSPVFSRDGRADVGFQMDVDQPGAIYAAQPAQLLSGLPRLVDGSAEYPFQFTSHWSSASTQYTPGPTTHRRNHSGSTLSSQSSQLRSSDGSTFSQFRARASVASTHSVRSDQSGASRTKHIALAASALDFNSAPSGQIHEEPYQQHPRGPLPDPLLSPQDKEPYATCVSRTKRSRRTTKQPKYWCTSCSESFVEKYDWKRHEETYQERFQCYECDLCRKTYFLDKDFIHHHQRGHRCKTCAEKNHVEHAVRPRRARTGWGCGFCVHFDADWTDRCNHIAWHFEKNGDTMANWRHSVVILSLLKRPAVYAEWLRLLERKGRSNPRFGWNQHDTGRVEGYPHSGVEAPQLQDRLEFFVEGDCARDLVREVYERGLLRQRSKSNSPAPSVERGSERGARTAMETAMHRSRAASASTASTNVPAGARSTSVTRGRRSSSPDKKLPGLPRPPAVPPKDVDSIPSTTTATTISDFSLPEVPELAEDSESWNKFLSTIIGDYLVPTGVTELGELENGVQHGFAAR